MGKEYWWDDQFKALQGHGTIVVFQSKNGMYVQIVIEIPDL